MWDFFNVEIYLLYYDKGVEVDLSHWENFDFF